MIGNAGTPGHVEQCQNSAQGEGETAARRMRGAVQKHAQLVQRETKCHIEHGWDTR